MDYNPPSLASLSRQEYWSGLPFPFPGDVPNPRIDPGSPAVQANSLPTELQGKPKTVINLIKKPFKITRKPMPKYDLPSQLYNFKKLSTNHNFKKNNKIINQLQEPETI